MNDRVQEQLLGYLLGALEDEEQEAIDQQLKHDRTMRRQLAQIQEMLRPLRAAKRQFVVPAGLAERTCQLVAARRASAVPMQSGPTVSSPGSVQGDVCPAPSEPVAASLASSTTAVGTSGGWSWVDLAVAASILIAAVLLVFPAIESSRFRAQVTACQENLRQVGMALVQYSENNTGYFPYVPEQGRLAAAGVYAPTLLDGGYLARPNVVVCPGSPVAGNSHFAVPTLAQLQTVEAGDKLDQMRSTMGGSYGYSLGYVADGVYRPTRNLNRPMFALMADVPDYSQPHLQSLNHGGRGQNVLFEDGRVAFLPTPKPTQQVDNVFLNDTGQVAAGMQQNDSVISAGGMGPFESFTQVTDGQE